MVDHLLGVVHEFDLALELKYIELKNLRAYKAQTHMAALCQLRGAAAATSVTCGLGCKLAKYLAGSGFTISMLPLKYAPSSITMRAVLMFRTRVIQDGVHPSLHINYKNFDLKQYFKEGRGCRTEGTFRNPNDFGINKGLANLPYLQKIGRQINRRLLEVERVSHNSGLSGDSIQRVVQPAVTEDGKKSPGLKFGQPRVMALFLALTLFHHLIDGFRNHDLRQHVADLLGVSVAEYTSNQMTYDLRRLRLKGLIYRPPRTNRYFVTPYGWRVAGSSPAWMPVYSGPPWRCSPATTRFYRFRCGMLSTTPTPNWTYSFTKLFPFQRPSEKLDSFRKKSLTSDS